MFSTRDSSAFPRINLHYVRSQKTWRSRSTWPSRDWLEDDSKVAKVVRPPHQRLPGMIQDTSERASSESFFQLYKWVKVSAKRVTVFSNHTELLSF